MTKQQEIDILIQTADTLGDDSYMGPSLKKLIPWIESEIRSDFEPSLVTELKSAKEEVEYHKDLLNKLKEEEKKIADRIRNLELTSQIAEGQLSHIQDTVKDLHTYVCNTIKTTL